MGTFENNKSIAGSPVRPLRLWPGIVAIVLLILARFALKALVPGFEGFMWAIQGSLLCAAAIILWWLFFSRAPWPDRAGALVFIAAALGSSWLLKHESMGPAWLFAYAVPLVLVTFVAAAFAGRNLPNFSRRVVIAAAVLLSSLGWTLVRTDGIDGDHRAAFAWRWSATSEEKLLATPHPVPATLPAPALTEGVGPRVEDRRAAEHKPVAPAVADPEWLGFRGLNRDGIVPGVSVATDWLKTPPVEIWRKPIGPGWSSFAVQNGLIYTQEQRGGEELVTAYSAANGDLVWRHADPVRFFESNAGAGPRATPTLADGRVYTLGATGILNVLDAATGQRIWTADATSVTKQSVPDWGFSASPVVTHGLVIVYAGRLAAYEAATGQLKWLGESVGGSYSSPHLATIGGIEQLLILTPEGAAGLDPATGATLWRHEWKGLPIIQPSLIPGGGILISASQTQGTRRINLVPNHDGWRVDTGWTSLALKPYFNDTVIHKGHAYGFDARILTCIGLEDGKRLWKGGRYGNGQMLLLPDQDLLFILSEDGELALVEASPSGFTELARMPALEGKTWNHPVIASGVLFVRNAGEMAAFRLPLAPR